MVSVREREREGRGGSADASGPGRRDGPKEKTVPTGEEERK
jgi:hypothetical protein